MNSDTTNKNITEQVKRMHRKLAEEEAKEVQSLQATGELGRLHQIVEAMGDALVVFDPDRNLTRMNKAARDLFGYDEGEVSSLKVDDVIPEREYERILSVLKEAEETGDAVSVEPHHILTKRGDEVAVSATCTALKEMDGDTAGYIAILRDITEQERVASELERSLKAVETANRAKSAFLNTMSHELRTPLSTMIGMTEVITETALDKEQKKYVNLLAEAGDDLIGLIDDILAFTQIEAEVIELYEYDFDLLEIITGAYQVPAQKARCKGIVMSLHIDEGVPFVVTGDPLRLKEILSNLLGNAVKFTNTGGTIEVIVTIDKKKKAEEGAAHLLFAIKDTGIGIPEDKQQIIFDRFTQGDSSTTRPYGGVGLGLAIARRVADALDGNVWMESTPDVGSTFYVSLTFKTAKTEKKKEVPGDAADETGARRVLLVEDDKNLTFIVKKCLMETGCAVDVAANGIEALSMFTGGYDLVIMDLEMPEMDGYTATKELRGLEEKEGLAPTPIVALSAHTLGENVRKAIASGCDAHFAKPIKKDDLISMVKKYSKTTT